MPGTAETDDLAVSGGAQLGIPGVADKAIRLDGTSGYARTARPMVDGTKSFSVASWVRLPKLADGDTAARAVIDQSAGVATACFHPGATPGGIVSDAPRGGHDVPPGGRALEGTGDGATWLWDNACAGKPVTLHTVVTDTRFGDAVADTWFGRAPAGAVERPIDPPMYATPVGDVLVRDASVVYQVADDTARAWRTAGGADGLGHLFLVTVEGQKGGTAPLSSGATRSELAQLLKALNLVDAVNMDGGGSTTLNLRDQNGNEPPVTTTTDASPRHVADTVYAGVGGYGLAK